VLKAPPAIRATGFTLIELMIGIAIMAIVLTLGLPSFHVWMQNARLRTAAESISHGLQQARSEAVTRNTTVKFSLEAGSSWTVGCDTASASCPAAIQSRATGDGSSAAITVTPADGATIKFNSLGRMSSPTPGTGVFTKIDVDVDSAVLSATESRELRITVDVGGNVRLCDPSVASTDARACPESPP
jgi:type IV fimbrial biogenesis protein FimT